MIPTARYLFKFCHLSKMFAGLSVPSARRPFGQVSDRPNIIRPRVRSAKCPFGQCPVGQCTIGQVSDRPVSVRLSVRSAKCPFGQVSVRSGDRSVKCPFGQVSDRPNVIRPRVRSAEFSWAFCPETVKQTEGVDDNLQC